MNFWEISLCWMSFSFCLGILIFIIYYRRDFK
jgi:hypothetical protein